jgi:predicted PurR-regulated permease PerM
VAFLQFGSVGMALTVGTISLVINSIEGYLLTPWLTGRASRMNAVVVFAGILFWGWLWGAWGQLGMPIMMAVKSVCDRVERSANSWATDPTGVAAAAAFSPLLHRRRLQHGLPRRFILSYA